MIEYEYVTEASRLPHIAQEISEAEAVGLDTEATGLDPYTAKLRLVQLNTGKGIYVIDVWQTGTLEPILDVFRAQKTIIVIQNAKFEQKFFWHNFKVELWPLFDTYRASALVYNGKFHGKGVHDLYALYARELNIAPEVPDSGLSDWSKPNLDKWQLDYAAEDVIHLLNLRKVLRQKLIDEGLGKVALIEFGAIMPEAEMELNGFRLDADMWLALAAENAQLERKFQLELLHELPHPAKQMALPGFDPDFNLDSSSQVLKSLQLLGISDLQNTNEITLAQYTDKFPVVSKLFKYREYAQCRKTFGPDFLENISPVTGRIHTNYYPFTGAGRYSCSKPNLQQIPRDKRFRRCFRVEPGKRIVCADFSQIELRAAAEIANDQTLIGVYARDEDAHSLTASLVSGLPLDKIGKNSKERQEAKAVNFGFVFGMQAEKFVLYALKNYGVRLTLQDAIKFRTRYFDGYRGIRRWHQEVFSDENKKRGLALTIAGRLRYLPVTSHNEYANTPVQGSCADGLKAALRIVRARLKDQLQDHAKMVHMVHDEIILETDDDDEVANEAEKVLKKGMEDGIQPFFKKVPAKAEGGQGPSWAEK